MVTSSDAFPLTHAEIGIVPTEVPPRGFDPRTAPPDILGRYGILQRPSDGASSQYRKLWERMYPRGVNFVVPNFKSRAPTNRALAKSIPPGRVEYNNWAGIGIHAQDKAITKVSATWTVPNLATPRYVEDGTPCINSVWIGIDGFLPPNNDILQAGVDLVVSRQGSSLKVSIEPWWEWWKGQSFYFDKFPVSPGDVISCSIICAKGATTGSVIMTNSITRDHVSLSVPASAGTKLIGNCAEWIVERQTADANSDTLTELSEFGSIFFDNAFASTAATPKPEEIKSVGSGTLITMTANDGTTLLAGPTLVGQNTIRIDRL
jgi:Peptidase A4 family